MQCYLTDQRGDRILKEYTMETGSVTEYTLEPFERVTTSVRAVSVASNGARPLQAVATVRQSRLGVSTLI